MVHILLFLIMQKADILNAIKTLSVGKRKYEEIKSKKLGYSSLYDYFSNKLRDQRSYSFNKYQLANNKSLNTFQPKTVSAQEYCRMGIEMQMGGKLKEAERFYWQAIALKPDYAQVFNNLGVIMQKSHKFQEARKIYTHAIVLKPDYAIAYCNLGITLQKLGLLKEAETSYRQAILLKSDYAEAMLKLAIVLYYMNDLNEVIDILQNILLIDSDYFGLKAGVLLAIFSFLDGNIKMSKKYLMKTTHIWEETSEEFKNEKTYHRYLTKIIQSRKDTIYYRYNQKKDKILYVIGESHSLNSHQLHIQYSGIKFFCKSMLIVGCMQWHLGNPTRNQYKNKFEKFFSIVPKSSKVLLTIGEIDCRLDSGIIKHNNSYENNLNLTIENTIENYLKYILKINSVYNHDIIVQGVPCPNINVENYSKNELTKLIEVIKKFNSILKNKTKEKGLNFLDVYTLTNRGDGFSNAKWHLDSYHLSPDGMLEAWSKYVKKNNFEKNL